ncbi:MAG: ABC transporter [Flavobacteriaceae bacterium]|nr:ABC transporter [Flavobacteriaceae bacterium]|tara:strand:+ start:1312 stop:2271 length:960 start_codon:yes stop_codon:yes gene_type:complete
MFLEVKKLVKFYNKTPVIKGLDFTLKKGEIISFLGESGSGKTTFLKCLSGLEKINSGSIKLNGSKLNDNSIFVSPQKRKIGYVFQDYPLFPHLNLIENITLNLEKKFEKKLSSIIKLTNLESLLERYPHELSGGEQQRTCLARALVREPDLLLLDEPFSNLDSNIKLSIREEIYRIIKETKTTTILVTHDINDSLNIADRILIFKAGVMQQFDDPVKMYCEPANCYCAEILGDLNQINIANKTYYLRPEKIKVVSKSKNVLSVEKCFFQGKDYKIKAKFNNNIWHLFSDKSYKINDSIHIAYDKSDLIYFDNMCKSFFK